MNKLKNIWLKVFDFLDDILAYILTIIGIISSTYIPLLKSNINIDIKIDWGRIAIAAIVALLIIGKQETIIPDKEGNTIKAREGRKNKFLLRMINALAQGVLWSQITNL
jgi:hypothetical protein